MARHLRHQRPGRADRLAQQRLERQLGLGQPADHHAVGEHEQEAGEVDRVRAQREHARGGAGAQRLAQPLPGPVGQLLELAGDLAVALASSSSS